jgi:hypothetical protein
MTKHLTLKDAEIRNLKQRNNKLLLENRRLRQRVDEAELNLECAEGHLNFIWRCLPQQLRQNAWTKH